MADWRIDLASAAIVGSIAAARRIGKNNAIPEIAALRNQLRTVRADLKLNPHQDNFIKEAEIKAELKDVKKANKATQKVVRDGVAGAAIGGTASRLTQMGITKFRTPFKPQFSSQGSFSLNHDFHIWHADGNITSHAANSTVRLATGDKKIIAMTHEGVRYKVTINPGKNGGFRLSKPIIKQPPS